MRSDVSESSLALKNFRPKLRIDPFMRPLHRFTEIEASGGIILLLAIILALFFGNTSLASWYASVWETQMSLTIAGFHLELSLLQFINEGLMSLFFFVIGLEIKRELVLGELASLSKVAFPLTAAAFGLLIPAALFWLIQRNSVGAAAWTIPMGTDIAFVVGFLSLLGKRVPQTLKVTMMALVIAGNLAAVLISAGLYAQGFSREFFIAGLGFYLLIFVFNFLGMRRVMLYVLPALAMWYCIDKSGVHPTITGVLLGLAAPSVRLVNSVSLQSFVASFQGVLLRENSGQSVDREALRAVARESVSPLERLVTDLHPFLAFFILPLFALANTSFSIEASALESSLSWAVAFGLVLGKPLGIFACAWIADQSKLIRFPDGISAPVFLGASCLCGMGFTVSIFLAGLAVSDHDLNVAKTGVLMGSTVSAVLGLGLLHKFLPRRELEDHRPIPRDS